MKPLSLIFFFSLILIFGCSKEDEKPTWKSSGLGANAVFVDILRVEFLPITNQSITLYNASYYSQPIDLGAWNFYFEHTSDTSIYYIPSGTFLNQNDSITFSGGQITFQIDTITDTLFLKSPGYNGNGLVDTWSH